MTSLKSYPKALHIECVLVGLSGLMAFVAWDASFNMQVLLPVVLILILGHIHKGFYVSKANVAFSTLALAGAGFSLILNSFIDPVIVSEKSVIRLAYYAEILLFYIVVVSKNYTSDQLKLIVLYSIITGVVISAGTILAFLLGAVGKVAPVNIWGIELAENSTGALLVVYFLLSFLSFLSSNRLASKTILFCSMLIMGFGLLLTGSRAAYIGLALGFIVVFFFYLLRMEVSILSKILFVVLLVLLAWLFIDNAASILPDFTYKRLFTPNYDDTSDSTRMLLWSNGVEGIVQRPLFGYGIGNFNYYVVNNLGLSEHVVVVAHNTYLDVLLDVGIFGALVVSGMVINGMRGIVKTKELLPILISGLFTNLIIGAERTFELWYQIILLTILVRYASENGGYDAFSKIFSLDSFGFRKSYRKKNQDSLIECAHSSVHSFSKRSEL